MERHKPIPQPFFPCCIRTPKTHRCLNTLHPNPRDEFRTCCGCVEDLLVAEELWNDHKKLIFFPVASAATCTDSHLEVDQSTMCQYKAVLNRNPMPCPFHVVLWHGPCERDGPIGRVHKAVATERTVTIGSRQDLSLRSAARYDDEDEGILFRKQVDETTEGIRGDKGNGIISITRVNTRDKPFHGDPWNGISVRNRSGRSGNVISTDRYRCRWSDRTKTVNPRTGRSDLYLCGVAKLPNSGRKWHWRRWSFKPFKCPASRRIHASSGHRRDLLGLHASPGSQLHHVPEREERRGGGALEREKSGAARERAWSLAQGLTLY
ncbi:hypothetical protein Taro_030051 [Colocasia esculenta]|uniref:Uncharacterized protein n=1 Tax=Colocasia esculenta TaxID=4460 RepID=A0A843VSZ1_COLES|nr:hypothetical protein [Colocasia esculenta]